MVPFGRGDSGSERQITRSVVWRMRRGETIRDSELHGFGIAAGDDGKVYFLETAIGGEQRRYEIGRHGEPWTPEAARAEAWRLKAELMRQADASGASAGHAGRKRRRRLTGSIVNSLKPSEIAWDNEVTGFGARCQRVNKVYFLKTRIGRRQRWITIGAHGAEWSPESARREARRLLAEIAAGNGPAAEEPPRRKLTVAELCERYLKEGCDGKQASTIATDRGRIERHIKPLLGGRRIASVTTADIEAFAAAVTAGETATDVRTRPRGRAIVTGGAGTATRTLGLLSAIFGFAVKRGLLERNPVRGLRRDAPRQARPAPSADDLARLGAALAAAERDGAEPGAVATLRLMVLTGCRSTELLALTRADLDLERACLRVKDGGRGQRFVALSAPALALLRGLAQGAAETPLLPGQTRAGRLPALAPLWRRVKLQAGLTELRPQDLAGCFAALGPEAMEDFLRATPPTPADQAPAAQAGIEPPPGPQVQIVTVPRPPAAAAASRPLVGWGPEAARPSAALLAWRAKAEAAGEAPLSEIDGAD